MSLLQTFYLSTVVYFALALSFSYLLVRRTRTVDRAETLEALKRALRIWGKPIDHERLIEIWKRLRRFDEKADRLLKKSRTARVILSAVSACLFISSLLDEWSDRPENRETVLIFFLLMISSVAIARLLAFVISRHIHSLLHKFEALLK